MMKELTKIGALDTSALTVTGQTVAENIEKAENGDKNVIRPVENPYSQTGGLAILWGQYRAGRLRGSAAPWHRRCWCTAARPAFSTTRKRRSRLFTGNASSRAMWWSSAGEGPKGGPGMREMLNPTSALAGMKLG